MRLLCPYGVSLEYFICDLFFIESCWFYHRLIFLNAKVYNKKQQTSWFVFVFIYFCCYKRMVKLKVKSSIFDFGQFINYL